MGLLILSAVTIFIFGGLIGGLVVRSQAKFGEINRIFGRPYRAAVIEIIDTGGHPQLRLGTASLCLHPAGAMSIDTKVWTWAQVQEINILDAGPGGRCVAVKLKDEQGMCQITFSARREFEALAAELRQAWRKQYLC